MNPITQNTFSPLIILYSQMDDTWDNIADTYRFQCNGCEDNCCKSLFFHHTYIEKAYLLHGFDQLDQDKKKGIKVKADTYCKETFGQHPEIRSLKIMCPLNENDRCLLYPYRPMICRLHGLPHELCRPGSNPVRGKGCDAGQFDGMPYIKFDRTLFYQQMARVEMVFRQQLHQTGKLKETVAQMLVSS